VVGIAVEDIDVVFIHICNRLSNSWILVHEPWMYPNRYLFATYKPVNEENNNSCKVIGVGTIKIKMFD